MDFFKREALAVLWRWGARISVRRACLVASVGLAAAAMGRAGFGQAHTSAEVEDRDAAEIQESIDLVSLIRRGEAHLKSGERAEGLRLLREARHELTALAASRPESARIRYALGLCSLFLGQMEEAEEAFEEALHREPDFALASLGLIKVYEAEGSYYRATAVARAALERAPGSHPLRKALAEVLMANGKLRQAIEHFKGLRNEFPKRREYADRLIGLYLKIGDAKELEALLGDLAERGEISEVDRLLLMAKLHLDAGAVREVPRLLGQVRRAEPEHPQLAGYFGRYYRLLGEEAVEKGDWSRAVLFFNRALEHAPEEAAIRQALGSAYVEMEEFEAANGQFMAILDTTPSDPEFYADFARAQMGLGRERLAFQVIDEAYRASREHGNEAAMKRFEEVRLELSRQLRARHGDSGASGTTGLRAAE